MVMGADTESAPERQKEKVIVQRTNQLMYEAVGAVSGHSGFSPAYGWALGLRSARPRGLPYIGRTRNFPHHLFASATRATA